MELDSLIVSTIRQKLPESISLSKYLMDTLALGKESAYRRIRGQVPFTLKEIAVIAEDLSFSVDEIIGKGIRRDTICFDFSIDLSKDFSEVFRDMLENAAGMMKRLAEAQHLEILICLNRVPFYYYSFPSLGKYEYCRYLFSRGGIPVNCSFDSIVVPEDIQEAQKKAAFWFGKLRGIKCVVDHNIIGNLIDEIRYMKQRQFLSEENVALLQKEIMEFCMEISHLIQDPSSKSLIIFYSPILIDANYAYYSFDGETMVQYWIYYESPIVVMNNPFLCDLHKRSLEGRIKNSILVSNSNAVLQAQWIKEISEIIGSLSGPSAAL